MNDIDTWVNGMITGVICVLILVTILFTYIGHSVFALQSECEKNLPRTQTCEIIISAQPVQE